MSQSSGSNLYSQGFGTTSTTSLPGNAIIKDRPPEPSDIKGPSGVFPIGQLWVDEVSESSWQLMSFSSSGGVVTANWTVLGGATSAVNTLSGDSGVATPLGGNIEIAGSGPISTLASGDSVTISFSGGTLAVETLTGNTGGAISPTGGNINVVGSGALAIGGSGSTLTGAITPGTFLVAALNPDSGGNIGPVAGVVNIAAGTGVTTTGSGNTVTIGLTGGGVAIDSVGTQAGTNPIVPDGNGLITINGAVTAAGSTPVRSNGTGANTLAIEVQTSQAVAATDATKIGLAAFDSAAFSVDANGFVSLTGGGLAVDSFTPNSGTTPVVPDGAGLVALQGTGSITTVGGLNSITPQLTGLTNHNVLVGAGTATITKVAPTATTGVPLVSNGSSADPSFSTALIAGGGTASTSFTTYGPVVAGATSTSALTSVAPSAIVGIPFVSQGAASNPAFSTAVVAGGGTGSTAFISYGPVVAASTATGALTSLAPSATVGIPLVSQGASANPAFSTSVVAGGGTGVTSFTSFAPVCGGLTSTGDLQSADSGIATAGFVLTSTGSSSLPTWQAAADAEGIETINTNSGSITATANAVSILGSGSITTSGTASTETISLTGLTNHAVLVGAGTDTITKVGPTATAGQVLQSAGSSADPAFSTATYPSTTTANQLLYSSATNTVGGLATANSAQIVTNATGVPAWTASMTDGQIVIGDTSGTPVPGTLTAGAGIGIVNGAGSIIVTNLAPVLDQYMEFTTQTYNTGTVAQSGFTVTGTGTTFTSDMVGGLLRYLDGTITIISAYVSPTQLTAFDSQTVADQGFVLDYNGLTGENTGYFAVTNTITTEDIVTRGLTQYGILTSGGVSGNVAATTLTDGELLIGSTGVAPVAATLTAGFGVSIDNAAGSITITASDSYSWIDVQPGTVVTNLENDTGYSINSGASLRTLPLPTTAPVGSWIQIDGNSTGLWRVSQNAGQSIHVINTTTTVGVGGSITSTVQWASIKLRCVVADTEWVIESGAFAALTIV